MRSAHWLKRTTRDFYPRAVFALGWADRRTDELRPGEPVAAAGLAGWSLGVLWRDGERYQSGAVWQGDDAAGALARLAQTCPRSGPTWLVCDRALYAASLIDLWGALERHEWRIPDPLPPGRAGCGPPWQGSCVLADPPVILHVTPASGGAGFLLLDVRNFGAVTMSDLAVEAALLGAVEHSATDPLASGVNAAFWRMLCLRLWLARWLNIVAEHLPGGPRTTAAGQSFGTWRRGYLNESVLVHSNAAALTLERASLHCGRQEALRVGHVSGPLYHLDYRSCYPAIAAVASLPARLRGLWHNRCPDPIGLARRGFQATAEVTLDTRSPDYPRSKDGHTCWPVGRFRTVLAHPELMRACESGHVHAVHAVSCYEPAPVLAGLMSHLMTLRQDCDGLHLYACSAALKACANQLFGRMASRGGGWTYRPDIGPPSPWEQWSEYNQADRRWYTLRSIAGRTYLRTDSTSGPESCPALTAHIWSAARVLLADLLRAAGRWHSVYLGTDALVTSAAGWDGIQAAGGGDKSAGPRLVVKRVLPWMRVWGPGHYEVPGEQTHAGVPDGAAGDWEQGFSWWAPATIEEHLLSGQRPGPVLIQRRAHAGLQRYQGRIDGNGRIDPVELREP